MITRRKFFSGTAALFGASALAQRIAGGTKLLAAQATPSTSLGAKVNYRPVVTPNGTTLPWVMKGGVKEFHLTAEPVKREFAPGMIVNCWGYNGLTPGPTIEAPGGWGAEKSGASPRTGPRGNDRNIAAHWGG